MKRRRKKRNDQGTANYWCLQWSFVDSLEEWVNYCCAKYWRTASPIWRTLLDYPSSWWDGNNSQKPIPHLNVKSKVNSDCLCTSEMPPFPSDNLPSSSCSSKILNSILPSWHTPASGVLNHSESSTTIPYLSPCSTPKQIPTKIPSRPYKPCLFQNKRRKLWHGKVWKLKCG